MRTVRRGARAAFVFLTRVPVGGFPYSGEEWWWASGMSPFVGMVLGAVCAAAWVLAAPLGPWVAGMTVLVVSILLTGAFHEDGLADTADALGGAAHDREKIFVILKDSRVGAFGALALVISIAFRLVLLAGLGAAAPAALVLAHCLARVGPVWLMAALPYVSGADAKNRQVARAGTAQAVMATVVGAAVCVGLVAGGGLATGGWQVGAPHVGDALAGALAGGSVIGLAGVLAAAGAMAAGTALSGWRFRARAGGVTGDFLGATEQVNEIVILLAVLAVLGVVP